MNRIIFIAGCLGFLGASGCSSNDGQKKTTENAALNAGPRAMPEAKATPEAELRSEENPQTGIETGQAGSPKESLFSVTRFSTASEALRHLIKTYEPLVLGIGELHQKEDTSGIESALKRFTDEMLPTIADRAADLVVETWVSTGKCGETEKKVTKEVAEVTERPAETENETVMLLKAAVKQNIAPHVLKMSCDDYHRVYEGAEGTDYLALLELVGDHLGKEAKKARDARKKQKDEAKPMTVIYGGALHNDATPSEIWKTVSFGPSLVKAVGAEHYLEVDLIVPEFAEKSKVVQKEPWMPTVRSAASKTDVALVRLDERSYLLVLPLGVKTEENPATETRGAAPPPIVLKP